MTPNINHTPDIKLSIKQTFGIESDMEVDAFSKSSEYVPEIDKTYKFDKDTTLAILSGFSFNKRVLIQGYHGTGKSTHIEQIAARLNWPCIRINLDSHVSRIDLIGKDSIVIKDGKQVTEFKEGILPWSIQNPVALVFDEYDAGRPDVMFVIQRVLESEGSFTLLDKNKVIKQNKFFRLFATTNTVGLGDTTGLYHGTQQINQGQMDRWNIVSTLNYLSLDKEMEIILGKNKNLNNPKPLSKVLWVGRMLSWKRVDTLIYALENLQKQGFNAFLTLVGDGPCRKKLEYLAKRILNPSSYIFIDPIDVQKISKLMSENDIYVLPSSAYEGWGAVINEAMSSGCAIVASKTAGAAAAMIKNNFNGLLFESGNLRELSFKLRLLIDDKNFGYKLIKEAKHTIENDWSANCAANRFICVANSLLSDKLPPIYKNGPMSKA